MSAPDSTKWGNIIPDESSSSQGKLGINYTIVEDADTIFKVTFDVWFWSRYSVDDTNNKFYYDRDKSSASTYIGKHTIDHTSNSSWSKSNQTLVYSDTVTLDKRNTSYNYYVAAKFTGIDILGSSSVAQVSHYVTVPTISEYKIKFYGNAEGVTGVPSVITKKRDVAATIPTSKPTRSGYVFVGWSTSSSATLADSRYAPGSKYTTNSDLTLYAVWTNITYVITLDANGGVFESGSSVLQGKPHGVSVILVNVVPLRNKHIFRGWSTTPNGGVEYPIASYYHENKNITLYAVWEFVYEKPRITDLAVSRCSRILQYTAIDYYLMDDDNRVVIYEELDENDEPLYYTITPDGKRITLSLDIDYYIGEINGEYIVVIQDTEDNEYYILSNTYKLEIVESQAGNYYTTYNGNEVTVIKNNNGQYYMISDSGRWAIVQFEWETDLGSARYDIYHKLPEQDWGDVEPTVGQTFGLDTSGEITVQVGQGELSLENVYDIRVVVSDERDSTSAFSTLAGAKFVIDLKSGGDGIAFGKPASMSNMAEFEFDAKFNGSVYGKVPGMDRVTSIPEGDDANDYLEPGCYAIYSNEIALTVNCIPYDVAGRLEVWSSTGFGVPTDGYSNIRQVYRPFQLTYPVVERDISRAEEGWTYGPWHNTTVANRVIYSNTSGSNGTISLSAALKDFHHIEIFFTDNNGIGRGSVKINTYNAPSTLRVDLSLIEAAASTATYIRRTRYTLSGSTMIPNLTMAGYTYLVTNSAVAHQNATTNYIYITEVIGYYS